MTLTLSMLFLVTMREGMIFIYEGLFKQIWNTKYIRHSVDGLYWWGKTLCRNLLSMGKWIGKIECWCKVDSLLFWMKMSEKGHEELVLDNRIWYHLVLPWLLPQLLFILSKLLYSCEVPFMKMASCRLKKVKKKSLFQLKWRFLSCRTRLKRCMVEER